MLDRMTVDGGVRRLPRSRAAQADAWVVWAGALLTIVVYAVRTLGDPSLPGSQPTAPDGWWGWFDQGVTLRSVAALARLNLDASQHHYPLGYALLGLPFFGALPRHAFVVVDLLCLLGVYLGMVSLARRLGLPGMVAAALFAGAVLADAVLLRQWVVPWNTTPVGAFVWGVLALSAAWLDGTRRPVLLGLLAGGVAACRPSDALVLLPCLATLALADRAALLRRPGEMARLAAGAALVLLPVVVLHLAIYGPAQSLYMRSSAAIGFTLHDFAWKAYVLLVDPYPWFQDGKGLLQHAHWLALGLAGLLPALLRGAKDRMLAATLLVHGTLYIAYVDLLPTGLWRFLNVHYFAWAIPGYALVAALLLRDLLRAGRPRRVALASAVLALVVLAVRVVPVPARADRPALAVDFAGPPAPFFDTFFSGKLALRDARGVLPDMTAMRAFLFPGGVRVFGLRRGLYGAVAWVPGQAPPGYEGSLPAARWDWSLRLGWPPRWFRRASPPGIPVPVE